MYDSFFEHRYHTDDFILKVLITRLITINEQVTDIVSSRVIGAEAKAALGFQLHVTDIFLEELAKVGGEELPFEVVKAFLRPFVDQLKGGREERLRDQVSTCIGVRA